MTGGQTSLFDEINEEKSATVEEKRSAQRRKLVIVRATLEENLLHQQYFEKQ
jgi:hypothetical protein